MQTYFFIIIHTYLMRIYAIEYVFNKHIQTVRWTNIKRLKERLFQFMRVA